MQKNTAGKWIVFAFGSPTHATLAGKPITGDAANITANIRLDGGAANAVDDTNPAELEDGYYVFDITAAESNADLLSMHPASSTTDVLVIGVPGALYTTSFTASDIAAIKAKTDNLPTDPADQSLLLAATNTILADTNAILTDTSTTIPAQIAALNNLDSAGAQAAAAAALTAYGAATQTDVTNVRQATPRKNQAFPDFQFVMRLASDHWTAATGKTVTCEVMLEDDDYIAATGTVSEKSDGTYIFDAAAADTNGNTVMWKFSAADCDDVFVSFKTSI